MEKAVLNSWWKSKENITNKTIRSDSATNNVDQLRQSSGPLAYCDLDSSLSRSLQKTRIGRHGLNNIIIIDDNNQLFSQQVYRQNESTYITISL